MRLTASPLLRNILALYSIQGLQYLIPLISLPWLVHSLGPANYGIMNLAIAFGTYLQLVGDYGFNLSASRRISHLRNDPRELSRYVSSVMLAKLLLLSIAALAAFVLIFAVPSFQAHKNALFIGCLGSLAGSLFPSWLFQGMERMVGMAKISIATKLVQLGLWMLLVRTPEHLLRALAIASSIALINSVIAWISAWKGIGLHPVRVGFSDAVHQLRDGIEVFLAQAGAVAIANTGIVVLGAFCDARSMGLYSIAEKIARACINLGSPVGNALYPRVGLLFHESRGKALAFLRHITPRIGSVFLAISLALFALAPVAAHFARAPATDIPEVASLVRILAILPFTVFLDNIFGTQILLHLEHRKTFMLGTLSAGTLGILLQFLLIPRLHAQGAALAYLGAELWCVGFFAFHARKASHEQ